MRMTKAPVVIPIGRDAIDNPNRLHLAILESFMLWPSDEIARNESIKTSEVEYAAPLARYAPEYVDIFAGMAKEAFPLPFMQQLAGKPFERGTIAGLVLRECVGRLSMGQDVKLSEAFKDNSHGFLTKKVFDNDVWPKFRPVAHFYAAWVDELLDEQDGIFPCKLSRMRIFLETAESYREAAENLRTKQSPKPILASGEAFRLPEYLGISSRRLSFGLKKTFPI